MPNESNKYSIRSLWVPNYRGADFTQTLLCQRGLKLAPLNFNRLTTYNDELRILLTDKDRDILLINVTKLNENTSHYKVHIPGYEIVPDDTITNGGGGVFLCKKKKKKNSIKFFIWNDL